jgi:arylformamidase
MKHDDPDWLEAMYNNRVRVPDHATHFERWARDSERVRASQACTLDIAYGPSAGQRLDVFPASRPGAPVVVFIHGGYWRSMDKKEHAFLAPTWTEAGACVVVPNYDLCPNVPLTEIVMQMVRAIAWTWRHIGEYGGDPSRISVAGHSAGGHLAAMMLTCLWDRYDRALPPQLVTRALSISGLFDLEPVRHTPSLQASLHLTPSQVRQASPALLPPPPRGQLAAVVGGSESMEFLRHNEMIRRAWGRAHVPVCEALPGLNHFSVVEALTAPGHRLNRLALDLLAD